MTDVEKVINRLNHFVIIGKSEESNNAIALAIESLQEKQERNKGCEYCNGATAEYQHTITTKMSIDVLGGARTIITECNPCPPYANCCMKNIPSRSAFAINFCPNCGKDLRKSENDG